jgi:hypothetical protein
VDRIFDCERESIVGAQVRVRTNAKVAIRFVVVGVLVVGLMCLALGYAL